MWPATRPSVDSARDALRLRLRRGLGRPGAARGQGRRARGDDRARRPGPGRLHDHDRRLPRLHGGRRRAPGRARGRGRGAHRRARGQDREALRRPRRPAPRLRPLRRRDLDARDDGHDPQPRPRRRRGRRAREGDRERALRERLLPAADPDVRRGRRRRRRATLRAGAHRPEGGARRQAGRRALGGRPGRAGRDLQADLRRGERRPVPAGRPLPAGEGRSRRLRLLGRAARAGVPAHVRDPRRPRHRRQRRPDGLRQQGRGLRHGRLLHARPVDGGAPALRRVPPERAGRGRRGRDPHTRADRADGRAHARGLRAAGGHVAPAGGALPRHAGHRVHRRGRHALPAPDAHGEADGRRGAAGGGGDGRRSADLEGGGCGADRPGAARPAPPPDDRPDGRRAGGGEGPERLAGRGLGRDRLRRRHGGGAGEGGGERDPRPLGDDARTTSTAWCRRPGS